MNKYLACSLLAAMLFSGSCRNSGEEKAVEYVVPEEILAIPEGNKYGLRAPEIELPDQDDQEISLSSLRGKLVLVDFWASWCPPCRKENPELVKLYEELKDTDFVNGQGFTIYSVSLDRNREAWLKAVDDDGLSWPHQVSDLEGARTQPAIDYGVQAIPSSFLLDQNGVIIGVNLRGEQLRTTLEDLIQEK